jgi:hypothetical protein
VPSVRFSRDKRGYEYIYLVHTPVKRGKPGRTRVLYWYRTPPGVRVGRQPFDEDVQRLLEQQNPDLTFDWETIIGTPMPPPDMTEFWRERRRLEKAARQERRAEEAAEQAEREAVAAASMPAPDQTVDEGGPDDDVEPDLEMEAQEAEDDTSEADGADTESPDTTTAAASPAVRRRRRRRRGRRPGSSPGEGSSDPGSQTS